MPCADFVSPIKDGIFSGLRVQISKYSYAYFRIGQMSCLIEWPKISKVSNLDDTFFMTWNTLKLISAIIAFIL